MSKRILDTKHDWQYLHVIIKAVGKGHASDPYVFCERKRKELLAQFRRFLDLYKPIELIGFCIVSNHIHAMFAIPKDFDISLSEVARRYEKCYPKQTMDGRSHKCHQLRKDLNNISKFCQRFERDFALRFNLKMNFNRTGSLWTPKFHDTLLLGWKSLARCWRYVEFNSVKAGLAKHPESYITGLWGVEDSEFREQCLQNFYKHFKRLVPNLNNSHISYEKFLDMVESLLSSEAEVYAKKGRKNYTHDNEIWHHRIIGDEEEIKEILSLNELDLRTHPPENIPDTKLFCL